MLNMHGINTFDSLKILASLNVRRHNFTEHLAIAKADELLQTTRQYKTWSRILQNDPAKAAKITRLILDRHAFIEGKAPTNEAGRIHFDRLTDRLKSEGIHLYKSYQFKNPIFEIKNDGGIHNTPGLNPINNAPDEKDNTMVQNLRYRFKNRDCLEFLADLLEENGIAYYGKNGLAHELISTAQNNGLNLNAYLTGEGLTKMLSSNPVNIRIKNGGSDSFEDVWNRIIPHMQKGTILSFSSQSFGHTGIVDRVGDRWVYFNSSRILKNPETYKVLSEDLKDEIQSWFQRAKHHKTFLDITIGAIDPYLAARFNKNSLDTKRSPGEDIDLLAYYRGDQSDTMVG